ncbi:hypothetical protein Slin15195_G130800 [Septoria linicola]|uniref:Uncharacterized protein n=1 Tax=Septoria linicola TaxID=215465 RepID=A0A9Q9EQF4_9PEZI|nr:hypothetical protein Slin14017_G128430 [Septoria linicola]USW59761.1 hypothetical protein Slin15195_G130800 [Septoria linicola]
MSKRQELPPSPPLSPKPTSAADDLLLALRRVSTGLSPFIAPATAPAPDQYALSLLPAQFELFVARLAADPQLQAWYEAHARYDYIPEEATYVLRMPDKVHEDFVSHFNHHVTEVILPLLRAHYHALRRIKLAGNRTLTFGAPTETPAAEAGKGEEQTIAEVGESSKRAAAEPGESAEAVSSDGVQAQSDHGETARARNTAALETKKPLITRSRNPDSCIVYDNHKWPALVAEVSYSQQRRALADLADDYLLDSDFHIRCVLAFDIPFRRTRRPTTDQSATVYLWRPAFNADGEAFSDLHLKGVPFRDASGVACDGDLRLRLADLVPEQVFDDLPQESKDTCPAITIPFATLTAWLQDAEKKTFVPPKPPLQRKRRRIRTPEEEIDEQREMKFRKQEQAADETGDADDPSWTQRGVYRGRQSMTPRRSSRLQDRTLHSGS